MSRAPSTTSSTHRTPRSVWVTASVLFVVVVALAAVSFVVGLAWWYRLGFSLLVVLFLFAFAEMFTRRVTLEPSGLTVVSHCRRRTLLPTEVESVTWEAGAGVSVKLRTGYWVKLPEVGNGSQGLSNSVGAWIRRTSGSRL